MAYTFYSQFDSGFSGLAATYQANSIVADDAGTPLNPITYTVAVVALQGTAYGVLVTMPDGISGWLSISDGSGNSVMADRVTFATSASTDTAAILAAISGLPSSVWAYSPRGLTTPVAAPSSVIAAGVLSLRRADTWQQTITGVPSLTGRQALWFTVKIDPNAEQDSEALIQIEESGGLLVLNGAPAPDATQGDITVSGTSVTLRVEAGASAQLEDFTLYRYDLKVMDATGNDEVVGEGTFVVLPTVTRAVA